MFAHITQQLRRRSARAVTLLAGVLVASMGFILLTGSVDTSRLRVESTADANFRAAYDILVRPAGAAGEVERAAGEVSPNFLSGQYGGITLEEWERIAALDGVEVAAPLAMVGNQRVVLWSELDVTELLDPSLDRQLLRIDRTWISDRGLTRAQDPGADYVYVSRHDLVWPLTRETEFGTELVREYVYDGQPLTADTAHCEQRRPVLEIQPDGQPRTLCPLNVMEGLGEMTPEGRARLIVVHWRQDGTFHTSGQAWVDNAETGDRVVIRMPWATTLLTAAVDPGAEARLVGLDEAVTTGEYLSAEPPEAEREGPDEIIPVPLLATADPQADEAVRYDISRVTSDATGIHGASSLDVARHLAAAPHRALDSEERDYADVYRSVFSGEGRAPVSYNRTVQADPPHYLLEAGPLTPEQVEQNVATAWQEVMQFGGTPPPWLSQDTGFRRLYGNAEINLPGVSLRPTQVGTFDPTAISTFSGLSEVPLESYRPAAAPGADERSRELLGERPWLPNSNPTGYLATPPQLLTNLASLDHLLHPASPQAAAPLSAVRVRVAGVTGLDDASQERVRQVAERIATGTGLTVDITVGSSPAPREVEVAAGQFGRPALLIEEHWTRKGAAVDLVREADRKSVLLSGLVLLVCALFTGNLVAASVRTRRAELGTLACLGWSGRRLAALVLGEVAAVAATAAVLAAVLAPLLAGLTGLTVRPALALLTVPLVIALALLAALGPALRAARIGPAGVLRPPVLAGGRARARRSVVALAAAQVTRVPVRAALAVLSLAVGIAAVTFVTAVLWHFRGAAAGTLLGQAVTLEIRAVDLAAVVLTVLLGAFALADVLYVGLRERDAELAVLRATGWSDRALTRLVMAEGALLGAAGAVLGAAAGAGLVAWVVGALPAGVLGTALGAAVGGVALAVAASLFPVRLVRGLPLAALLSRQ
ncbi:FtsX-like permease family protein [Streptomyces harbinensis]|uniref:FtsX-like permease family protein n=1 Tax=Streptomyces harbinensis TaxID=1176198 RepID=UPI003390F294